MKKVISAMPVLGVVLAGGRSSRMGSDKALLPWRGRPLIEHQIGLLRAAGVNAVVVSGSRPAYRGIRDAWAAGRGPLAGLASVALCHPGDRLLLAVPVDMPLLHAGLLRTLTQAAPASECLRFAGTVLPVRLCLNRHTRAVLADLVEDPVPVRRSLRMLQTVLGCDELPLDEGDRACWMDCNTRDDWERCHEGTDTGSGSARAGHAR